MGNKQLLQVFEHYKVRTIWDEDSQKWYFSVTDVVGILTDSTDPSAYWRKLKQRLKKEGNESVTNCHKLKLMASIFGGMLNNNYSLPEIKQPEIKEG